MNKRAAQRAHKHGLATGRVVEFYTPKPKPPAPPAPPERVLSVADILNEVLKGAANLTDIVVIMRDKNGTGGLISNLDGAGESFLFLEQVKYEIIQRMRQQPQPPQEPA
jgi:hypothetical protein